MIRSTLLTVATALALGACADSPNAPASPRGLSPAFAKANAWGFYTAVFDDALTNSLRSDARGAYVDDAVTDEPACVGSETLGGGLYQLRTIRNTGTCKAQTRGTWRHFTIDFGTTVPIDLDQDALAEAVEAAPGRLLADDAFASRATSTPVKIFILKVMPDSTSQNAAYLIQYRNKVKVSGTSVRVLQALPGTATVDIFDASGAFVTTRDLPFKLSLTRP